MIEKKIYSVLSTSRRDKALGAFILQLNSKEMIRLSLKSGKFAVVMLNDEDNILHIKSSIVKVLPDDNLLDNECRIDQSIRKRFKIMERDDHGYFGKISVYEIDYNNSLKNKFREYIMKFIKFISLYSLYQILIPNNPRTLLLNVRRMQREDVEKKISVIHEKYVNLMGLDYSKYIRIKAPVKQKDSFKIAEITTRIFPGIDDTIEMEQVDGKYEEEPYPDIEKIYLDPESRYKLGLGKLELRFEKTWPIVLVQPDIGKIIIERILYFVVSFFILIRQFMGLIETIVPISIVPNILLSSLFTIWIITFIVHVEIRNKTNY